MKYILIFIYMLPIIAYRTLHLICYIVWNFKIPKVVNIKVHFDKGNLPDADDHLRFEDIYYPKNFFSQPLFSIDKIKYTDIGKANLGISHNEPDNSIAFML